MTSSSRYSSRELQPLLLSSSHPTSARGATMAHEDSLRSRMEVESHKLSASDVDHNRQGVEHRQGRQRIDAKYEHAIQPKPAEYASQGKEQLRGRVRQRDKMPHVPEHQSSSTGNAALSQSVGALKDLSIEYLKDAEQHVASSSPPMMLQFAYRLQADSESVHGPQCNVDEDELSAHSPRQMTSKHSDSMHENNAPLSASQAAELKRAREKLLTDYDGIRGDLEEKHQLLEEREYRIRSLEADLSGLRELYKDQSAALLSRRHELKSCQAQLDNVQRFISTADAHAEQDLIQKLHELNEEVYKISMTMADSVAEHFARQNALDHRAREHWEVSLETIGPVMADHLAAVEGHEDTALLLQVAFQCHLSHVLCHVISSWTVNLKLDSLIEEMYRRIRNTETQAVSGHWRALTRTHILPSFQSHSTSLVAYTLTGLFDIVMAAGLVSQPDAMLEFNSEFGEKISSIVSHAGTFGNMVSAMISGHFDVFSVQPGATFHLQSMADMNEVQWSSPGARTAQTVLCVTRLGLRKQTGERTTMLTKAQVVLESFFS